MEIRAERAIFPTADSRCTDYDPVHRSSLFTSVGSVVPIQLCHESAREAARRSRGWVSGRKISRTLHATKIWTHRADRSRYVVPGMERALGCIYNFDGYASNVRLLTFSDWPRDHRTAVESDRYSRVVCAQGVCTRWVALSRAISATNTLTFQPRRARFGQGGCLRARGGSGIYAVRGLEAERDKCPVSFFLRKAFLVIAQLYGSVVC